MLMHPVTNQPIELEVCYFLGNQKCIILDDSSRSSAIVTSWKTLPSGKSAPTGNRAKSQLWRISAFMKLSIVRFLAWFKEEFEMQTKSMNFFKISEISGASNGRLGNEDRILHGWSWLPWFFRWIVANHFLSPICIASRNTGLLAG
jgi:hypothetical protein